MSHVDIGVVEKCESWRLDSKFFPSKVGGKPAWLSFENIPSKDDLKCNYCEKPCLFLCQVYAPYEDCDEAFHRTLFVFICTNVDCCKANQNGNIKVFRSQLKRENNFYSADPPVEEENWRPDIRVEKWAKVCQVCGISAPNHCAKCKKVNYCCREHQVLDWKASHKKTCGTEEKSATNKFLFPEYEIVIETEDTDSDHSDETYKEQEEIKKFELLVKEGCAGTLQSQEDIDNDLIKMANNEDKVFSKFNKKIKEWPNQILRYERGGHPLYISPSNKISNVPPCKLCGGERQFEFQIMPQLINYLQFKDSINSLDWGVLLIYTCKNSCTLQSTYAEEFIWKQDISTDNQ